jgi:hypothetical protein
MGQHKNPNRKPLPSRWILATKWVFSIPRFVEGADGKEGKLEYDQECSWTPIGTTPVGHKKGNYSGIPFSYASKEEAISAFKEILRIKDKEVASSNLLYCALEVKYTPNKIKVYKQQWFYDYVLQEVMLEAIEQIKDIIK